MVPHLLLALLHQPRVEEGRDLVHAAVDGVAHALQDHPHRLSKQTDLSSISVEYFCCHLDRVEDLADKYFPRVVHVEELEGPADLLLEPKQHQPMS